MWDALVNNPWILWLIIMLVLAGIEMLTLDFLFLMMSMAALGAGVVSFFTPSFPLQVITFAVVAVLLIFLLRPVALRRLNRSTPSTRSNAERLVGLSCTVLEPVSEDTGLVRLEGDIWTARSAERATLETGTKAYVYRIDGATAIVSHTAPATTDFSDSPAPQPGY
ncbi:NfeD family protein [Kocuria sp. cx-455]|uniref:NfeD family protein n=1 Tax=unclassified Candidatus Sulfotelmatobacter TaxID=2635724 RepID=UPI001687E6C5|nr:MULTISPECIES: NfeD family protein [unclassified Candidatus Sulfotelmatobacter]MBD2761509.1 NfeD family protein [Kocuria sp. cx-116]MBD2765483.1 NfeD family protein [Kocuria sp. cx-455]